MGNIGIQIGKEIRRRRNMLGMSQEELAFKSGISAAHLGQIERAMKNPTVDTVSNIADALGAPISELFLQCSAASENTHNSVAVNKINAHLSKMSEDDRRDVLKIIKIIEKNSKKP